MDAKVSTRKRKGGGRDSDAKVLGAYCRDALNKNGKRLPTLVANNKLAVDEYVLQHAKGWSLAYT